MALLKAFSTDEIHRYHRVVSHSVDVRSHFEMLLWLQGDMQRYLRELTEFLQDKHGDILKDIRENPKAKVDDKMRERLDKALTAFKGVFKPSAVSK